MQTEMQSRLTVRQFEIAHLYIYTGSRKRTACLLELSDETVKVTLRVVCKKLSIWHEDLTAYYMVNHKGESPDDNPILKYKPTVYCPPPRYIAATRCLALLLLVSVTGQIWNTYRDDDQHNKDQMTRTVRTGRTGRTRRQESETLLYYE